MQKDQTGFLNKTQGILEHELCFCGKPGDKIGPKGRLGSAGPKPVTQLQSLLTLMTPPHALENQIIPRLKG